MDEHFTPRPMARWYPAAAVASLLFMLLGCVVYAMHIYTDPTTLPLDQRVMFEAEPRWVTTALGIASLVGSIGALMLLLRRRAAVTLLLISLDLRILRGASGYWLRPALEPCSARTKSRSSLS